MGRPERPAVALARRRIVERAELWGLSLPLISPRRSIVQARMWPSQKARSCAREEVALVEVGAVCGPRGGNGGRGERSGLSR